VNLIVQKINGYISIKKDGKVLVLTIEQAKSLGKILSLLKE